MSDTEKVAAVAMMVAAMRLRLDESMRGQRFELHRATKWGGMAEMIALVAGTEATEEYNAAVTRVKEES